MATKRMRPPPPTRGFLASNFAVGSQALVDHPFFEGLDWAGVLHAATRGEGIRGAFGFKRSWDRFMSVRVRGRVCARAGVRGWVGEWKWG